MGELRLAVAGAGGRMGAANIRAIAASQGVRLTAALEREGSMALGKDAGVLAGIDPLNVLVSSDAEAVLSQAEAILDFTMPGASVSLARLTARRGLVHVIGTTGCSDADEAALREAANAGARIVKSGNFSLGVNLLQELVRQAAAALPDYDIEILEMHHGRKVDAPSGTALLLGEAAAKGRAISLSEASVRVRDGHTGPRQAGTIGFATLRGGTVVGDHTVFFAGPSERIEITHRAEDRTIFANGAVHAARWATGRPAGYYTMADVLGLAI